MKPEMPENSFIIPLSKPYKGKKADVPMICKVQKPIVQRTKHTEAIKYLIYNADRTLHGFVPEDLHLKLMFPTGVYKVYAYYEVDEAGNVTLAGPAPEQEW